MALSMPLNGLKEEDKDPIIELFVKVSTRRAFRPAEPAACSRSLGAASLSAQRSLAPAPPRGARLPGLSEALLSRPRPIVLGPPSPSRCRGLSREPG